MCGRGKQLKCSNHLSPAKEKPMKEVRDRSKRPVINIIFGGWPLMDDEENDVRNLKKLPEVQIPEAEHSRLVSGRGRGRGGGGLERAGRRSLVEVAEGRAGRRSRRGGLVGGRLVAERLRARCRSLVAVVRAAAGRRSRRGGLVGGRLVAERLRARCGRWSPSSAQLVTPSRRGGLVGGRLVAERLRARCRSLVAVVRAAGHRSRRGELVGGRLVAERLRARCRSLVAVVRAAGCRSRRGGLVIRGPDPSSSDATRLHRKISSRFLAVSAKDAAFLPPRLATPVTPMGLTADGPVALQGLARVEVPVVFCYLVYLCERTPCSPDGRSSCSSMPRCSYHSAIRKP
nr:uncharacterized protein LOC109181715 isoform X2 [Ipomoea batatas]